MDSGSRKKKKNADINSSKSFADRKKTRSQMVYDTFSTSSSSSEGSMALQRAESSPEVKFQTKTLIKTYSNKRLNTNGLSEAPMSIQSKPKDTVRIINRNEWQEMDIYDKCQLFKSLVILNSPHSSTASIDKELWVENWLNECNKITALLRKKPIHIQKNPVKLGPRYKKQKNYTKKEISVYAKGACRRYLRSRKNKNILTEAEKYVESTGSKLQAMDFDSEAVLEKFYDGRIVKDKQLVVVVNPLPIEGLLSCHESEEQEFRNKTNEILVKYAKYGKTYVLRRYQDPTANGLQSDIVDQMPLLQKMSNTPAVGKKTLSSRGNKDEMPVLVEESSDEAPIVIDGSSDEIPAVVDETPDEQITAVDKNKLSILVDWTDSDTKPTADDRKNLIKQNGGTQTVKTATVGYEADDETPLLTKARLGAPKNKNQTPVKKDQINTHKPRAKKGKKKLASKKKPVRSNDLRNRKRSLRIAAERSVINRWISSINIKSETINNSRLLKLFQPDGSVKMHLFTSIENIRRN